MAQQDVVAEERDTAAELHATQQVYQDRTGQQYVSLAGIHGLHDRTGAPRSTRDSSVDAAMKKQKLVSRIQQICGTLKLPSSMTPQVALLIAQFMRDKQNYAASMDLVIGSCIYLAARLNKQALTLGDVADAIETPLDRFGRVYRRVVEQLQLRKFRFKTARCLLIAPCAVVLCSDRRSVLFTVCAFAACRL